MTTYNNHRVEPYFSFLKNGKKTIEGRLNKGKYKDIKSGDTIIVNLADDNKNGKIETEVLGVKKYDSFRELFKKEGFRKIIPDVKTEGEALMVYRKFYSEKMENKFGVVAIEGRVVKNEN